MAWIEVHQALLTHRKTLRLARLLHMDTFAVVGRLMALWCWGLDNAPDGMIAAQDSDLLADVLGWDGAPGDLCGALVTAGFLDRDDAGGGYTIHDWQDYAGKLSDRRERNKLAMRAARAATKGEATDNLTVLDTCTPRDDTCKATVPNRTLQNRTQPERENAREASCEMASELPTASGPITDLSLSPIASQETAEAEPEAVRTPIRDPKADRDTVHALYDAWCVASGNKAGTASERRTWHRILAEMARDVGLGPPGCAPLVASYRAKFGADKHPTPGQVAAVYSQLEPSREHGTDQHPGPSSQQTSEARARDEQTHREAKHAAITALAAELAAG